MIEGKPKAYSYIRFSTPGQKKGDSLRRQLELSERYAKENDLILDNTLKMNDFGLSAFKGHHTEKGALGKFLELVQAGKIEPGSFLIVESLDRLSRETVINALEQFTTLIRNGIKIVTLQDNMLYSKETIENSYSQLLISISIMSRAFEESLTKSKRLKAAWDNKRTKLTTENKKLTSKAPAWLKLNKKNQTFELIPERADIVLRIFREYLAGKGVVTISKQFNKEGLENWGKQKNGWHRSYIQKILHSKAVLGEFQPGKMVSEKNLPAGEPIKNYFPPLISHDDFFRVKEKLIQNTTFKGKTGNLHSLFTRLVKCAYCGSNVVFLNKGSTQKGGKYLSCSKADLAMGCNSKPIKYDPFEKTILEFCIGLNISDLLDAKGNQSEISALLNHQKSISGELNSLEAEKKNLLSAISQSPDETVQVQLMENLQGRNDSIKNLQAEGLDIDRKLKALSTIKEDTATKLFGLKTFYETLNSANYQERIDLRIKIRSKLRELIDYIEIFPNGYTEKWIDSLIEMNKKQDPNFNQEVLSNIKEYFQTRNKEVKESIVIINFFSGTRRTLYPEVNNRQAEDFEIDGQTVIMKSKTCIFKWDLKTKEQHSITSTEIKLFDALFHFEGKENSEKIQKGLDKCKVCKNSFDIDRNSCPLVTLCHEFDMRILDQLQNSDHSDNIDKAILNSWFKDETIINCPNFVKI